MTNKSPSVSRRKTGSHGPVRSSTEPADRLGFYVIGFIGIVGVALALWIQLAYSPSIWTHLIAAVPPVLLACLLPILLKGWLMGSRSNFEAKAKRIEPPANTRGVKKQAAA